MGTDYAEIQGRHGGRSQGILEKSHFGSPRPNGCVYRFSGLAAQRGEFLAHWATQKHRYMDGIRCCRLADSVGFTL